MKKTLDNLVKEFSQWWFNQLTVRVTGHNLSFRYIVKYPAGGKSLTPLPMLIALHGDGDNADNFYQTALDMFTASVRIILIKGPIAHECGMVWPYSADQFMRYGEAFGGAVDRLVEIYPTIGDPILLGFSGGGTMAYYQSVKQGHRYAYIFPISGLLMIEQLGDKRTKTGAKVFAYHGKDDQVVPFSTGKKAVNILKKNGVNISFTMFEGGHQALFRDKKSQITHAVEEKIKSLYITKAL